MSYLQHEARRDPLVLYLRRVRFSEAVGGRVFCGQHEVLRSQTEPGVLPDVSHGDAESDLPEEQDVVDPSSESAEPTEAADSEPADQAVGY